MIKRSRLHLAVVVLAELIILGYLIFGIFFMQFYFMTGKVTEIQGITYYVSPTGSDSNSGTSPSTPWKTLTKVNSASFNAGDGIFFEKGGVWTGELKIQSSGQSGLPITVSSYGSGSKPIIRNPGSWTYGITINADWIIIENLLLKDSNYSGIHISTGADYNVVRNCEFTNDGSAVVLDGQYNLITNNTIYNMSMVVNTVGGTDDFGANGLLVRSPNNEISYNFMDRCIAPSYDYILDGGGIELYGNVDNTYIHHNKISNSQGVIEIGSDSGTGTASNVRVVYNVFIENHGAFGSQHNGLSDRYYSKISNFRIEQNTIKETTCIADNNEDWVFIWLSEPAQPNQIIVRNNIVYIPCVRHLSNYDLNHSYNIYNLSTRYDGGSQLIYYNSATKPGAGEFFGDPRFVNKEIGDLHLQSISPAIDKGADLGYTRDFDNVLVPSGNAPDLGAYEYNDTATNPPINPADPLLAGYNFEGNLLDSTGKYNASCTNCPSLTSDRNNVANRAYLFNGVANYASTSLNLRNEDNITFLIWFKSNNNAALGHIFWEGQSIANGWGDEQEMHLSIGRSVTTVENNKLNFYLGGINSETGTIDLSTNLVDNNWHHAVVVLKNLNSNPSGELYLDGVIKATDTGTLTNINRAAWNTAFTIASPGVASRFFYGVIDDLKIYNRIMDDTEISNIYNNEKPVATAVCNNGIIEAGEVCDSSNLGGKTCANYGFNSGTLKCSSDCKSFDTSSCYNADTTLPIITSIGDSPDPLTKGNNITINASVTDNVAVNSVWVVINTVKYMMTYSSGSWKLSHNTSSESGTVSYTVYANDSSGNNANTVSGTYVVSIPTEVIPATPSNLAATSPSRGVIVLNWKDNSNNEQGFKLERSLKSGSGYSQIATIGANLNSYTNTGLTSKKIYYYRIRAYNTAGNSAYSNVASTLTL